jgi:hypothetical protein
VHGTNIEKIICEVFHLARDTLSDYFSISATSTMIMYFSVLFGFGLDIM